jgi:hypothetical protein
VKVKIFKKEQKLLNTTANEKLQWLFYLIGYSLLHHIGKLLWNTYS